MRIFADICERPALSTTRNLTHIPGTAVYHANLADDMLRDCFLKDGVIGGLILDGFRRSHGSCRFRLLGRRWLRLRGLSAVRTAIIAVGVYMEDDVIAKFEGERGMLGTCVGGFRE